MALLLFTFTTAFFVCLDNRKKKKIICPTTAPALLCASIGCRLVGSEHEAATTYSSHSPHIGTSKERITIDVGYLYACRAGTTPTK